jgi:two-component system, OmpR family, response regulator
MRILLVEDDIPLAEGLKQSLHRENYAVDWVSTGQLAISAARAGDIELLILDLGLPDMDGLEVLHKIKKIDESLPVLILTARDGVENKVIGLDLGAEDYLAKPFEIAELLARLRVIERRIGTSKSAVLSIDNVEIDTSAHIISCNGTKLDFSRREYMILKSLMESAGRIQSKAQLENKLYEWGEEVSSNTIEVHIHNIRKKLPNDVSKDFIKTVRGVGYIVRKS